MNESLGGTLSRFVLQELADQYFNDAQILLAAGSWASSYYLAGYSIECALKACIARETREHDFPDKGVIASYHTHNLANLVKLAGLEEERLEMAGASAPFRQNWKPVFDWKETARYFPQSQQNAEDLILAIGDNETGVLPWIKARW